MTSLDNIFVRKKQPVKINFGLQIFICESNSIIFEAHFMTFGMLKDDNLKVGG